MHLAEIHLPPFVASHLRWFVAIVVVVVGFLIVGLGDVLRFFEDAGWKRARAIASVCYREAIRRRILWITPVAIIGVIVAVQLLNPVDDQDAIRQTVKYALFTSGILVVLATIILACTNLPREIENRVIFTIVTKPTTRLEIVLGKIMGFARVSATILVIMGVFTWAYAAIRASHFHAKAVAKLDTVLDTDPAKRSLQHAVQNGFLEAKNYVEPVSYEEFVRAPKPGDTARWIAGDGEQAVLVPFDLPTELLPENAQPLSNGGLQVEAKIEYEPDETIKHWPLPDWHPTPFVGEEPEPDRFPKYRLKSPIPFVEFQIFGPDRFTLIPPNELVRGGRVVLSVWRPAKMRKMLTLTPANLDRLYKVPPHPAHRIYVRFVGFGPFHYGMGRGGIRLFSPKLNRYIDPVPEANGEPSWPEFHGRDFLGNQQLRCASDPAKAVVGVFHFRNARFPQDEQVPFEFRALIEGSGDDSSAGDVPTRIYLDAMSLKTGESTGQIQFNIESNRTTYFSLPAKALSDGDFDLHLRAVAPGRYLTIRSGGMHPTLQAVAGNELFAWNLFKSLLVIWLLSLLVVIVAVFCSTFVSWPIAVVLTVVILIVNWGAQQIGGSGSGLGAAMARDLGAREAATAKVVGSAVEGLTSLLQNVAKFLPDISSFSAMEDIERSVNMPGHVVWDAVKVILAFGVPLTVLAYVFLKRKEVAP